MSGVQIHFRDLSPWEAWGLLIVAASLAFYAFRSFRAGAARGGTLWPMAARAAAWILATLLFLAPTVEFRRRAAEAPVAVVADASLSMLTTDEGGFSRWVALTRALRDNDAALKGNAKPVFLRLDRGLRPLDAGAPAGPASDFSRLADLKAQVPGLKGVVFLTDGRHGGGPDPAAAWASLGVPVHTVGAGDPAAAADAAVDDVRAAPFGFKNVPAEARLRLAFRALPPGRARLAIYSRGRLLGSRWIDRVREDVIETTVSFRPGTAGAETFEARLEVFPGEANVRNNIASFTMDIGRDRRRVLYICGKPGPHYAYLRQQLKNDPTVELVTFVILRDMEDVASAFGQELSLIPFPTQAELLEGLPSFDAVIFENFSFQKFGVGLPGMEALRRFVLAGGGFLLIGDGGSFGPGSPYRGSPMEPLLPFRLEAAPAPGPFRFLAAPEAAGPFSPFEEGRETPLAPLEGDGLFPSAVGKGGEVVLRARGAGAPLPLAAVASAGKGRVMALASLTTWRWALGGAVDGRGPAAYVRFWGRTLSWLTGDESAKRVRLLPPEAGAVPGGDIPVRVYVRDDAQRPVHDADVRYTLIQSDGARRSGVLSAAGGGEYAAAAPLSAGGPVRVEVRAQRGGRLWGQDSAVLAAGAAWDEARDVTPDLPRLQALSTATGGRFVPLKGFTGAWARETLEPLSWESEAKIPLGERAWPAGALVLLLLAEWFFRRRRGLP